EKGAQQQQKQQQAKKESSAGQELFKAVMPWLNRAQELHLKQSVEGINGVLALAIGSEEGKININKIYDFDKHKFIGQGQAQGDMRVFAQEIFALLKEKVGADLFESFEKFLKERKYPINDVTELLTIKEFVVFKDAVFYNPLDKIPADSKPKIYLTDIFTVST